MPGEVRQHLSLKRPGNFSDAFARPVDQRVESAVEAMGAPRMLEFYLVGDSPEEAGEKFAENSLLAPEVGIERGPRDSRETADLLDTRLLEADPLELLEGSPKHSLMTCFRGIAHISYLRTDRVSKPTP